MDANPELHDWISNPVVGRESVAAWLAMSRAIISHEPLQRTKQQNRARLRVPIPTFRTADLWRMQRNSLRHCQRAAGGANKMRLTALFGPRRKYLSNQPVLAALGRRMGHRPRPAEAISQASRLGRRAGVPLMTSPRVSFDGITADAD